MLGFVKFHVLCSFSSTVVYFALRESVSCFSFPSVLSYFSSVWFCMSCPVLFSPVVSCSISVLSCPVLHVLSSSVLFSPVVSCSTSVLSCSACLVQFCPVLSSPVLFCPVLSCSVLSCPVLFCPVLFQFILFYFVSFYTQGEITDDLYNDFNRRSKNGMKTLC